MHRPQRVRVCGTGCCFFVVGEANKQHLYFAIFRQPVGRQEARLDDVLEPVVIRPVVTRPAVKKVCYGSGDRVLVRVGAYRQY